MFLSDILCLTPSCGGYVTTQHDSTKETMMSAKLLEKRLRDAGLNRKDVRKLPSTQKEIRSNQTLLGNAPTAASVSGGGGAKLNGTGLRRKRHML